MIQFSDLNNFVITCYSYAVQCTKQFYLCMFITKMHSFFVIINCLKTMLFELNLKMPVVLYIVCKFHDEWTKRNGSELLGKTSGSIDLH